MRIKFFLSCVLLLGCVVPAIAQAAYTRSFPSTQSTAVSVFADQLPMQNMNDAQIRFAAQHYVGTQKIYTNQIDKLRTLNPQFLLLHYRLAQAAGPAPGIAHDSGFNGNNFSSEEWEKNMSGKDWFILSNGSRIRNTSWNWYPFDLARSESLRNQIADYWIDRVKKETAVNKSDGVFADSFGIPFGPWSGGTAPGYAYDSNWHINIDQAKTWLSSSLVPYADRVWHGLQTAGQYYIPNCGQLITSWDTIENYTHSDGCMIEGFTGFDTSITEASDWELEMNNILTLAHRGKVTIAQTNFNSESDLQRRGFIVGSYLISKGPKSYVNMFSSQNSGVVLQWYPEYEIPLGSYSSLPQNVNELKWNGVFRRNFSNGFVLVNPYSQSKTVQLGGTYQQAQVSGGGTVASSGAVPGSVSYQSVTSVTLPAQSAVFFLNAGGTPAPTPVITPAPATCPLEMDQAYKAPNASAVFYVDLDCKKRPFKSSFIYFTYFDSWTKVRVVSANQLAQIPPHILGFMPFGPKYDPKYGALVKTVTDPKVYFLLNGKKYWITSEAIFNALRYQWNWIEDIDPRLLEKYLVGGEITDTTRHLDGTIVKYANSPDVYVLVSGQKKHIADEQTFRNLGYRFDRVVVISDAEVYATVPAEVNVSNPVNGDNRRIIIRAK